MIDQTCETYIMKTFSNNEYLVTGDFDGKIRIWELENYTLENMSRQ